MRDVVDAVSRQADEIRTILRRASKELMVLQHVAECAEYYDEMVEKHGMTNGTTILALKLLKDSVAEWRKQ